MMKRILREVKRKCLGCGKEFTCVVTSSQRYCNPLCRINSRYERKLQGLCK